MKTLILALGVCLVSLPSLAQNANETIPSKEYFLAGSLRYNYAATDFGRDNDLNFSTTIGYKNQQSNETWFTLNNLTYSGQRRNDNMVHSIMLDATYTKKYSLLKKEKSELLLGGFANFLLGMNDFNPGVASIVPSRSSVIAVGLGLDLTYQVNLSNRLKLGVAINPTIISSSFFHTTFDNPSIPANQRSTSGFNFDVLPPNQYGQLFLSFKLKK